MRSIHEVTKPLPRPVFGFVDANNLKRSLEEKLSRVGLGAHKNRFQASKILSQVDCDRNYVFGAIRNESDPDHWLKLIQREPRTIFKAETLTEKNGIIKEQGVDVRLAIEAIKCSHKKIMKSCVIFSADGDLLPLIKELVDDGVVVTVVSFSDPEHGIVAPALRDNSDHYYKISNFDILKLASPRASRQEIFLMESQLPKNSIGTIIPDDKNSPSISEWKDNQVICRDPDPSDRSRRSSSMSKYYVYSNSADAEISYRLLGLNSFPVFPMSF